MRKYILEIINKRKFGFTLIEVLVAIFIFTLIVAALSGLIITAYRSQSYTWQQSTAVEEARRGIETMVQELRQARDGENGTYPIEKAGDKEIIFYSDIDKDNKTEKVRYFWGGINSGQQTKECVTFLKGGSCSISFSDFLTGKLKSAQIKIEIEGDFGMSNEYAEIFVDGNKIDDLCVSGCTDCAGVWQGTKNFDVIQCASDNSVLVLVDATQSVDNSCSWIEPNHSMKVKAEFSWTEEVTGLGNELIKEVIEPTSYPAEYPEDQKKVSILTSYVRNEPPIFEYFDKDGNKILDYPARLVDTKVIRVFLAVDVDVNNPPSPFELESSAMLRNLKE